MPKNGNGHNGRYTAAQVAEAITEAKGFVSTAAKRLGCGRTTIYRYIDKYATVKQAVDDAREDMKDFAEAKLFQLIKSENITAIIFYLKCQAKDRGYIDRVQHEHSGRDGGPIETHDITGDRAAILGALCRIADRGSAAEVAEEPDGSAGPEAPA